MNKSSWNPLSISLVFIGLGSLMAFTDLFHPIIVFIHSKNITALQAAACIFVGVIGLYFAFNVLVSLGACFLPEDYNLLNVQY